MRKSIKNKSNNSIKKSKIKLSALYDINIKSVLLVFPKDNYIKLRRKFRFTPLKTIYFSRNRLMKKEGSQI
jgi:hypothetical protein